MVKRFRVRSYRVNAITAAQKMSTIDFSVSDMAIGDVQCERGDSVHRISSNFSLSIFLGPLNVLILISISPMTL